MSSYFTRSNLQLSSFALVTVGWILSLASMGRMDWRVWHLEENPSSMVSSGITWVGIWKVCFYSTILHPPPQEKSGKICHSYIKYDNFLPQDFRIVQNIFLFACILGAMGKVSITIAMRNFYLGIPQRSAICNPFTIGGFFYISAGICILICVIWNYHSVFTNESITFPDTFHIPPSPETQEIGDAVSMAIIAAILMLLGGIFFLSLKGGKHTGTSSNVETSKSKRKFFKIKEKN
ncbi:claudin-34-like [Sminthopsis crassicaudata]|uniref:claudin-34-like n=1 Tax=Sminthopsis crassicaudata TaxID=9301 RepID=UPI003D6872BB